MFVYFKKIVVLLEVPRLVNLAPFTRSKPKANEMSSQSTESTEFNYEFIVFLAFSRLHWVCKELL